MTPQTKQHASAADAITATLSDLLELRPQEPARAGQDGALNATTNQTQDRFLEHRNYSFDLPSPLHRLSPKLRLHVAVARFVWMMAANNRLADIAFYEPKVAHYSDDQLTVPGSNYGMRLRQPQAGLDQIAGVIERLKKDQNTRRAAVAIFQPVDAVRESNDIPCAFGMMLHARDGRLDATLLMRSNNATTLLPFNIFEFSLLMETIAVEAGLELGMLHYFAGSMHLFERDIERAEGIVSQTSTPVPAMEAMPRSPKPLEQLTILGQLDAELRHNSSAINRHTVDEWCDKIRDRLAPYWAQFGYLLLGAIAAQVDQPTLSAVTARLNANLRPFQPTLSVEAAKKSLSHEVTGGLFGGQPDTNVHQFRRPAAEKEFARLAIAHEIEKGAIGAGRLLRAREEVMTRLAARNDSLTPELFEKILSSVE